MFFLICDKYFREELLNIDSDIALWITVGLGSAHFIKSQFWGGTKDVWPLAHVEQESPFNFNK